MDEIETNDSNVLNSALDQTQANLESLEAQLREVDAELERRAGEREQFSVLARVCADLEALSGQQAGELFWSQLPGAVSGTEQLAAIRQRIDAFEREVGEIESRRDTLLFKIRDEEGNAEDIQLELYEAQLEEEARKREWMIERDASPDPDRVTMMPWARGGEDDERFRKSLLASLLLSLFLGLLFPWIDIPIPESWQPEEVPERFTRLVREEPPPPPPKPMELKPTTTKPETSDKPVVAEKKTPEPAAKPEAQVAKKARKKAESTGILAFREKFSGLSENKASSKLGAQARIKHASNKPGQGAVRSMVATQAAGTSGGIDLASVSRDIGGTGGAIEGVEVGTASSSIGDIVGDARPLSGGPGPARTDEEIQIVFDKHKAALYRLYNRELRRDPTLKGQVVLRFQIEPDGSVSLCEVQSTDMDAPNLAKQVVSRVSKFDFGAKEGVPPVVIVYPIDFLPAS